MSPRRRGATAGGSPADAPPSEASPPGPSRRTRRRAAEGTDPSAPGGGRRARRQAEPSRRVPALVVVGVALGAVVAAGATVEGRDGTVEGTGLRPGALAPVAPAEDALGSTWFCAGGPAAEGDVSAVVVANLGEAAVDVVLTVLPGGPAGEPLDADPVEDELTVPAGTRTQVVVADLVEAAYAGVVVEAGRGEIVVEQALQDGDLGVAPCASSSSASWYVAASQTTRDATAELLLLNPFPDDAVVDITFTTPEGLRSPEAFTGLILPGRRLTAVDVGEVVSRHPNVSTAVLARSGRIVVQRIQRFDGTDGPAGVDLTPGAPAPALLWQLPDGLVTEGVSEVVTVFNPTDDPAEVDVEVDLDPPGADDPAGATVAAPYQQTIAPHGFAQIVLSDAEDGRVPPNRGHAVTVRSQNGVPVVAERWIRSTAPAPRTGLAATLGSPLVATRWLAAVGGASRDVLAEFLTLVNPATDGIARVSIAVVTPSQLLTLEGLEEVEVAAQGRLSLDLGSYINRDDLLLVVTSTEPIVAERGLYPVGAGLTASMLVPSGPTASIPSP